MGCVGVAIPGVTVKIINPETHVCIMRLIFNYYIPVIYSMCIW
jgi:hypothetical protein